MSKTSIWAQYEHRLSRVTAYIHDHLDEDIDLNRLSEIACLSPYHWHRIYRAIHGETIAMTVKRARMYRAAGYLTHNTAMSIEEVARKTGYPNLQSFTRIFNSVFGVPPARYRRDGSQTRFQTQNRDEVEGMYDVTIKPIPDMIVATLEHTGPYVEIGRAYETLFGWLGTRNLIGPDLRTIGIYYDDPEAVPEDKLRSRAGIVVTEDFPIEPPLDLIEVDGGDYAILRYKGPYTDMHLAYRWFFSEWLRQSGREAGDAPMFEEYLNNPRDTPPTELVTDIFMPLR